MNKFKLFFTSFVFLIGFAVFTGSAQAAAEFSFGNHEYGTLGQTAGTIQTVPEGWGLSGIGYGSDDHRCTLQIKTVPVNSDGTLDWRNRNIGWQNAECDKPGLNTVAEIDLRSNFVNVPAGSSPWENHIMTGWSWGAETTGGKPGDDDSPSDECFFQQYMNLETKQQQAWGGEWDGTCNDRGYETGWMKKYILAPPGHVIFAIKMSLGDDATIKWLGATSREVAVAKVAELDTSVDRIDLNPSKTSETNQIFNAEANNGSGFFVETCPTSGALESGDVFRFFVRCPDPTTEVRANRENFTTTVNPAPSENGKGNVTVFARSSPGTAKVEGSPKTIPVSYTADPAEIPPPACSAAPAIAEIGQSITFTGAPESGNYTWSSSPSASNSSQNGNQFFASFSSQGVKIITITDVATQKSGTCNVTINPPPVVVTPTKIKCSLSASTSTVGPGQEVTLIATTNPDGKGMAWYGKDNNGSVFGPLSAGTTEYKETYRYSQLTPGSTYERWFKTTGDQQCENGESNHVTVTASKPISPPQPVGKISCSARPSQDTSVPYQFDLSVGNAKPDHNYNWSAPCTWKEHSSTYSTLKIDCGGAQGIYSALVTEAATGQSATCSNFCGSPNPEDCVVSPESPQPTFGTGWLKAAKGTIQTIEHHECDDDGHCDDWTTQEWRPMEAYSSSITHPAPLNLVGLKFGTGRSWNFDGISQVQFDCTRDGTFEKTINVNAHSGDAVTDGICNYPTAGTYTAYARGVDRNGQISNSCRQAGFVGSGPCEGTATIRATSVVVPPSVDLDYDPSTSDQTGKMIKDTYNLFWNVTQADSCTASATPFRSDWNGSKPVFTPPDGTNRQRFMKVTATTLFSITCTGRGGSATDSVEIRAAGDVFAYVTVDQPNYCTSGPAATVLWTYYKPYSTYDYGQTAYRMQIDDNSNFNNPEVDTSKVISGSQAYATGQGILQFNKTYYYRVKGWDDFGRESPWSSSSGWTTPKHAYPQVNFTWNPNTPSPNQSVQFTDQTVFSDNGGGSRTWAWIFGDGGSANTQNPTHTYTDDGNYTVNLTATDKDGLTCAYAPPPGKTITVKRAIPTWKEVPPKP